MQNHNVTAAVGSFAWKEKLDPVSSLVISSFVQLCHHHWAFCMCHWHTSDINNCTLERIPSTLPSLTSEPRRTQAGEVPHPVLTGGSVPAGLRGTLVHVNLAVAALESRHAEARVAVPSCPADGAVLAGVRGALVLCGGRPVWSDALMMTEWLHLVMTLVLLLIMTKD